jgi:uncharacterized protein YabE (DUF348 family)
LMMFDDDLQFSDWDSPSETRPRPPIRPAQPALHFLIPVIVCGVVGALALAAVLVFLLMNIQRVPVTIIVSGNAHQIHSRATTVSDLLEEAGIVLDDGDTISPTLESKLTPGLVVRIEKARSLTLTVDGETRLLRTTLTNPAEILASVAVRPTDTDRITVDGTNTTAADLALWPVPPSHIVIRRAVDVQINDRGETTIQRTTGETVGEVLYEAGLTLYLADSVSPDLSTPVQPDMRIDIYRSRPVSIIADGETVQTRTRGDQVADALADAGVALAGLDYTIPGEDAPLLPGMHIRVIRVREEFVTETASIPFERLYQADAALELDQRAVVRAGAAGSEQTRIRVRYENGVEVEREPVETTIEREAVDEIVAYGTRVIVRTVDTPDGVREYWRVVRLYATSYHPAALGGDNITATGRELRQGIVAADRDILPFGTLVFVPGYGVGEVADTAPERASPLWIDLGYSDADYQPWSRPIEVYLLTPIPAEIDYLLPR